jgi:hypothetical protein
VERVDYIGCESTWWKNDLYGVAREHAVPNAGQPPHSATCVELKVEVTRAQQQFATGNKKGAGGAADGESGWAGEIAGARY